MKYSASLFLGKSLKSSLAVLGNYFLIAVALLLGALNQLSAQDTTSTVPTNLTLKDCIDYALQNQPQLKQSIIGVSIAKTTNAINISGWLPQVQASANFVHYTQQPTAYITNPADPTGAQVAVKSGVVNTFIPAVSASQAIFSPTLLYAATSSKLYVKAAKQVIDSTKIGIVTNVSKAFYNLLLTLKEIEVLKEDTVRLSHNYNDAYHQYVGGIVDETDYEEAAISLNNSKAQLRQANENLIPQYALLKQLMGYPSQNQFNVSFDTSEMLKNISLDTTQQLQYEKRIEYQQLATTRALQHKQTNYYWVSLAPTLGIYYNYNYEYENNKLPQLLSTAYPNSLFGINFSLPIFTGLSRLESVHRSKLQEKILELSEVNLKAEIYTEYTQSIAAYRGNLYNLNLQQDNVAMARRVYNVVNLQYKQGIVAYLNVITAESNLISSEIGYINALFQVLSSKIDVERSMGVISY